MTTPNTSSTNQVTEQELIELALLELRELFRDWHCEISVAFYLGEKTSRVYKRFDVHCTDFANNDWTEHGPTLESAMEGARRQSS